MITTTEIEKLRLRIKALSQNYSEEYIDAVLIVRFQASLGIKTVKTEMNNFFKSK